MSLAEYMLHVVDFEFESIMDQIRPTSELEVWRSNTGVDQFLRVRPTIVLVFITLFQ